MSGEGGTPAPDGGPFGTGGDVFRAVGRSLGTGGSLNLSVGSGEVPQAVRSGVATTFGGWIFAGGTLTGIELSRRRDGCGMSYRSVLRR